MANTTVEGGTCLEETIQTAIGPGPAGRRPRFNTTSSSKGLDYRRTQRHR